MMEFPFFKGCGGHNAGRLACKPGHPARQTVADRISAEGRHNLRHRTCAMAGRAFRIRALFIRQGYPMFLRLPRLLALLALPSLMAFGASAADWEPYTNARFGYVLDVPEDFVIKSEADNGDGMTLASEDGKATLRVFGGYITDGTFRSDVQDRMKTASGQDAWAISYNKISDTAASFSGSKKDDVLYVRGVPLCENSVAFFYLEYPKDQLKAYDDIVSHMVKSLQPLEKCG
jgi:hypothetical protein